MIVINVTLTTQAPLSICMPVAEGIRANRFNNFPLLTRGLDGEGEKLQTGYLPATTLRGFFRRAIVEHDMKKAADNGSPYKLPQAYTELIGQDAASEQQAGQIDLVALKEAREATPVLDLFGSGLGIKSRLRVSHFLPHHNVLPDAITGTRKDLDDNEVAFDLLEDSEKEMFYGRSTANSKRAKAVILMTNLERKRRNAVKKKEDITELDAQLEEATKLAEKYASDMGDMTNSSRTILTHYAIGAGLELTGRLVIENDKDRDVELLMVALRALSLFPILGAQSARGCGEISGQFDFFKDGELFKKVSIGGFKAALETNL